jgi:hypothetical protein
MAKFKLCDCIYYLSAIVDIIVSYSNTLVPRAMGWKAGARFSAGARDLSLLHSVQTGSSAHPTSYPMGLGGFFPRG